MEVSGNFLTILTLHDFTKFFDNIQQLPDDTKIQDFIQHYEYSFRFSYAITFHYKRQLVGLAEERMGFMVFQQLVVASHQISHRVDHIVICPASRISISCNTKEFCFHSALVCMMKILICCPYLHWLSHPNRPHRTLCC